MLILKRQDVEISSIQHPKREQKIPILKYQDQSFRLINVFAQDQAEEAKNFWRELTDNQGKFCILLEEPNRHSVWGRIRLDQIGIKEADLENDLNITPLAQAGLLLLQTVYIDVEDLLGNRQAKQFQKDIGQVLSDWKFPEVEKPEAIGRLLLQVDPLDLSQIPPWEEHHVITLLQELYRLGKDYFGNTTFAEEVEDILQDQPAQERKQFLSWLQQSPLGKQWQ
ncbi:MAG: Npun_F0813 family protein [Spirulinaceae cyanobacterium]